MKYNFFFYLLTVEAVSKTHLTPNRGVVALLKMLAEESELKLKVS